MENEEENWKLGFQKSDLNNNAFYSSSINSGAFHFTLLFNYDYIAIGKEVWVGICCIQKHPGPGLSSFAVSNQDNRGANNNYSILFTFAQEKYLNSGSLLSVCVGRRSNKTVALERETKPKKIFSFTKIRRHWRNLQAEETKQNEKEMKTGKQVKYVTSFESHQYKQYVAFLRSCSFFHTSLWIHPFAG